jgi:predicted CoA-binding protein
VPEYLQGAGVTVVPIPVYYPEVTHILGEPVFRSVAAAAAAAPTQPLDIVCVFRRSSDVAAHVEDILAVRAQHARQARVRAVCVCACAIVECRRRGACVQARPRAVWLQSGIRDDDAVKAWARAGLRVVQDRCLYVEHAAATRGR